MYSAMFSLRLACAMYMSVVCVSGIRFSGLQRYREAACHEDLFSARFVNSHRQGGGRLRRHAERRDVEAHRGSEGMDVVRYAPFLQASGTPRYGQVYEVFRF